MRSWLDIADEEVVIPALLRTTRSAEGDKVAVAEVAPSSFLTRVTDAAMAVDATVDCELSRTR